MVTELTGVQIDAGAVLTYQAARELTDAVGGVPVCLPTRVQSHHTRRVYPAGCQQLDGAAAVDVLRQRYGMPDGGLDRDRNAQRYAAGLLRRVDERGVLTNPALLDQVARPARPRPSVVDTGEHAPCRRWLRAAARAGAGKARSRSELPGPVHRAEQPRYLSSIPELAPGFLDRAARRPAA